MVRAVQPEAPCGGERDSVVRELFPADDASLVQRSLSGDVGAQSRLYERNAP
jgi:hypothetical protein